MSPRVLIVGGGFAGFWAALAARRVAPGAEIALVSRQAMLEMITLQRRRAAGGVELIVTECAQTLCMCGSVGLQRRRRAR